jgi:hypothetical protein
METPADPVNREPLQDFLKRTGLSKHIVLKMGERGELKVVNTGGRYFVIHNKTESEMQKEIHELKSMVFQMCKHLGVKVS